MLYFLRLTRTTRHLFLNETGRKYTLSPVNRAMLYMKWLRSYPSYHNLALILNVSVATVHKAHMMLETRKSISDKWSRREYNI
jgi:hypothetical protein